MSSLRGIAYYAIQHQLVGVPLKVNVGGKARCGVVEMAPNILATAAGEGPVPQFRFVCDGYCGEFARRPSKACRAIDRAMISSTPVAAPPGLIGAVSGVTLPTPYRPGEAVSGLPTTTTPMLPAPRG